LLVWFSINNKIAIGFLRFQYPHEYEQPRIKTAFPGPEHKKALDNIQSYNPDGLYKVFIYSVEYFIDSLSFSIKDSLT